MACFTVPAVEAIVVTASYFAVKRKERKLEAPKLKNNAVGEASDESSSRIKLSRKISWLMMMLWGGVFLLVVDHIWSGEIVPYPPFLAAMSNPEDTAEMLYEIKTLGVAMSVSITVFWGFICAAASAVSKLKLRLVKEN